MRDETWSGPLWDSLFGLAPDGVFRAVPLTRDAVRSYRTFSPLPPACAVGGLIFCGTIRRKVFQLSARVYPGRTGPGYAASRPLVFGLSSPVPQCGTEAILRPSKTIGNLAAKRVADKRGLNIVTFTVCVHSGEFRKSYDPD